MSGRRASNAIPIAIFATVVIAGTLGAWAYTRRDIQPHAIAAPAAGPSPERVALDEAKALCASGDCETARDKIEGAIGESSALRSSQDFKDIETKWADQVLARADGEKDTAAKEAMYQRVSQAMGVDAARRKTAADKLQQLEALNDSVAIGGTGLGAGRAAGEAAREESVCGDARIPRGPGGASAPTWPKPSRSPRPAAPVGACGGSCNDAEGRAPSASTIASGRSPCRERRTRRCFSSTSSSSGSTTARRPTARSGCSSGPARTSAIAPASRRRAPRSPRSRSSRRLAASRGDGVKSYPQRMTLCAK